jgi:hypothetical protein
MQTSPVSIRLCEFVGKNGGAFECPIHGVALCMFLLADGNKRVAIKSERSAHPAGRKCLSGPVDEDKAGEIAVG